MYEESAKRLSFRIPYAILVPMFVIVAIGIINLSSAAQATRPDLYINQLMRFGLAFFLMTVVSFTHPRFIRHLAFLAYAGSIMLLMLVLVVGVTAKGAERWLVLGPLRIQPSDPAKFALIVALARYCSLHWPHQGYSLLSLLKPFNVSRPLGMLLLMVFLLVRSSHHKNIFSDQLLLSKSGMALMVALLFFGLLWLMYAIFRLYQDGFSILSIVAPIDIALVPFLLIAVEPDLATGLVTLFIAGCIFLFVGIRRSSIILGSMAFAIAAVGAYFFLLMDYQRQRILTFLNPEADLLGEGYQSMQSIIAIGSGRIMGKGFNGGTQTQLSFLPENATDFVFSVWAEEWGFVACLFLISLYFLLLWSILKLATKVDDQFSQLICVGVAAYIFVHVFVNIGMVTGLLPVAGVPLPLMSYGGNSMNITLMSIGLVVNVALWRGEK